MLAQVKLRFQNLPFLLICASCAAVGSPQRLPDTWGPAPSAPLHSQALIGVTEVNGVELTRDEAGLQEFGRETMPALGAVWQQPLSQGVVDLGVEGGVTVGWEGGRRTRTTGSGNESTATSELIIADVFVGPFAALNLGQNVRAYGAAGAVLQYGQVSLRTTGGNGDDISVRDDSYETGYHARAGVELRVGRGTWMGLGARWFDSSIDVNGGEQAIDIVGMQYFFTISTGF
ncbi:MAG: hypothetical protein ACI841_001801 [Planctomycetota bacterium]|jgi:hypothetical protein